MQLMLEKYLRVILNLKNSLLREIIKKPSNFYMNFINDSY